MSYTKPLPPTGLGRYRLTNSLPQVPPTLPCLYTDQPAPPSWTAAQQPHEPYGPPARQDVANGYGPRRKQPRASQACNQCRTRKQRCDEARPCQFCKENNFDCQYKEVPPPKEDQGTMQLQESVNDIRDVLKNFARGFTSWRRSVESRLPLVQAPNCMKTESPSLGGSQMSPPASQAMTPIKQESLFATPEQPATAAESVRSEHGGGTGLPPKEKSGLQSDHTTPAHKLFEEWHSMANFCRGVDYVEKLIEDGHDVSEYPMLLEQDRGLLRLWGVGEGQGLNDDAQGPGSPDSGGDGDTSSPVPGKEGLWGFSPADTASPGTNGPTSHPKGSDGRLGPDGRPDFRSAILWELYDSYIENIHKLHPFMNASKLRWEKRGYTS